jgi:hypothetical protein
MRFFFTVAANQWCVAALVLGHFRAKRHKIQCQTTRNLPISTKQIWPTHFDTKYVRRMRVPLRRNHVFCHNLRSRCGVAHFPQSHTFTLLSRCARVRSNPPDPSSTSMPCTFPLAKRSLTLVPVAFLYHSTPSSLLTPVSTPSHRVLTNHFAARVCGGIVQSPQDHYCPGSHTPFRCACVRPACFRHETLTATPPSGPFKGRQTLHT